MRSPDARPSRLETMRRYWRIWRSGWRQEQAQETLPAPQGRAVEFLPAVLEIQETPPSPVGRATLWSIMLLLAATVLWAFLGRIDIVAVARGRIVSDGLSKTIQPLESGIVSAIRVDNGQHVRRGDVLIELDSTASGADRERFGNDYEAARVEIARLQALLRGDANFTPPAGADPAYAALQQRLLKDQQQEFRARLDEAERVMEQRQSAIMAARANILHLEQILPIATRRADALRTLYEQGNGSLLDADEAERQRLEKDQELAVSRQRLVAEEAALAEARKHREAIAAEFRKNAQSELAGIGSRAQGLAKDLVKATRADERQRLLSPVDGTVQQLAVHTIGGVVTPAQPVMVIVPDGDRLEVEAWVENKDVGFVEEGQIAAIKVDAFPFTRYGTIDGKVVTLSRDAVPREDAGHVFAARISMADKTMAIDNGKTVNLTPGMNVAVEIATGQRRLIEFLLSPLLRAVKESARER